MSEQPYRAEDITSAHFNSRQFARQMRASGVTAAQAAERLHAAAQHFDPAEFEVQIATHRPELWKRMNKRSSRTSRLLRRFTR